MAIIPTINGMMISSSPESGTSSRIAMITPPTIMIGAMIMMLNAMTRTIWTCCTSLVLRVINDGVPKVFVSFWEKSITLRKMALRTSRPPELHCRPRPEVDGADGADSQQARDEQHESAGAEDVVRVALDHTVVDDVGVEAGEGQ